MISENIHIFNYNNIIVCDPVKNSVLQESNFYKLLYTNNQIILNGLYIDFELKNINKTKERITFNNNDNDNGNNNDNDNNGNSFTINKLIEIEEYLLQSINSDKNKVNRLKDQLLNSFIRYNEYHIYQNYKFDNSTTNSLNTDKKFVVKFSGIWESNNTLGLTFKIILINNEIQF